MADIAEHLLVEKCARESSDRNDFWERLIGSTDTRLFAEVGVYRGDFAQGVLRSCPGVRQYYMIDPWRHLQGWNKPANQADDVFESYYQETLQKTDFAADRRTILRGKTTEVIDRIADESLDGAYIDGDHTLKGICIDLVRVFPKIRQGGWIGGDDFSKTIWQHPQQYEPTLVFPFAVYFAEAVQARIYALPYSQFLLQKSQSVGFEFIDWTSSYPSPELRHQVIAPKRSFGGGTGALGGSLRSLWRRVRDRIRFRCSS